MTFARRHRINRRLIGAGGESIAAAFNPTALGSTLKLLLQSHLGVTTPISTGVSVWEDTQSGGAIQWTQGTEPLRPLLTAAQLDGRPSLRYVVGQLLTGPALSALISLSQYTVFIVGRFTTLSGDSATLPHTNCNMLRVSSGRFVVGAMRVTGPNLQQQNHDGSHDVAIGASAGAEDVYALIQARHGGGFIATRWADQAEGTPVASGDTSLLTDIATLGNTTTFTGDIVAVAICDTSLDATNTDLMRAWFLSEYPSLAV